MRSESKLAVYKVKAVQIKKWIPSRRPTVNKSHGGRILVWAGQKSMPGAAILASKAASRVGAGYVYVSHSDVVNSFPEAIPWNGKTFEKIDSILIGPGLGTKPNVKNFIQKLKSTNLPIIIDADALTVAAKNKLAPFPSHWIATPHTGELSRFLGVGPNKINSNRIPAARAAQKKLGCIVVLKGLHTIVALKTKLL